ASGTRLSAEEIEARIAGGPTPVAPAPSSPAIAVLPIHGVIVPRAGMFSDVSGATSAEGLTARFNSAMADPRVRAIALDLDSPGGAVQGIQELGDAIYAARGTKPIVAVANHLAASAAYWLASQADELVVTPSGEVGSIRVLAVHDDP